MPTILGANTSSTAAYEVANSCRFNDGDSAYMTKTPGSDGNRQTFTISVWCKRGTLGSQQNILAETDWYITRKADAGTAVPSSITNHRAAVRTKAAEMETAITNASDTPALETLYAYVNTADEGDPPVMERPLGEFPELGS